MIFTETKLKGLFIIDVEAISDERGFFARTFCQKEFAQRGLISEFVQCSISHNKAKGTLRGMHYQARPHEEVKIVSCIRGAIFDVSIDLRPDSYSYKQWVGVELTAENNRSLYIPEGCAHGFLTLRDDAEVYYQISTFFHPNSAKGLKWDDPAFGIEWLETPIVVSEKDDSFEPFESE